MSTLQAKAETLRDHLGLKPDRPLHETIQTAAQELGLFVIQRRKSRVDVGELCREAVLHVQTIQLGLQSRALALANAPLAPA